MTDVQWLKENRLESATAINTDGDAALILAARQGRADILVQLIADGADIFALDGYGNNAVWAACYAESEGCVRELITAGCDPDYRNPNGNTAMAYAASSGKDALVHLLLELGADPNIANDDEMTPLDLAASLTSFKLLRAVCAA